MSETITRGSGNVFKDLGFDHPEEYQAKADLALHIITIIDDRGLTQNKAAARIGSEPPDFPKLNTGPLNGFTLDSFFSFPFRITLYL